MEATLGRWDIDGVEFDVETAWGLTVARGRFDRVAGSYKVGPQGTQLELMLDARSIVTEDGMWDDLLRSNELSGIAEHPRCVSRQLMSSIQAKGGSTSKAASKRRARSCRSRSTPLCTGSTTGSSWTSPRRVDGQQFGKSGGQLGMILPATVHVRVRLTPQRPDS
jgi:hypothetical protein